MFNLKSASSFTWSFLVGVFVLLAFGVYQDIALDEPVAVSPFLNSIFPETLGSVYEVSSEQRPTDRALSITPEPGGERIFVAEQNGRIYTFTATENGLIGRDLFMDLQTQVFSGQDSGMLGLAFHPEYNVAGSPNAAYIYMYYTANKDAGQVLRLSRFTGTTTGDPGSELVMLEQELGPTLHRGGGLLFGEDGFLYVAIGDLGYKEQSQNIDEMLAGGVLRIDVDMQGGAISHPARRTLADTEKGISGVGYYIPSDNPFLDENGGIFEEYYTIGSRNPHRMTIDRVTGLIYIGNAGSNSLQIREEVNLLEKGGNYGWPFREGTIDRPEDMARPSDSEMIGALVDPLHEYPKADGNCAVIGGYVYRGTAMPELVGKYIFTDYCGKKVWAMDVTGGPTAEKEELTTVPLNPYTLGEDADGELYIGVEGWNSIYKLGSSGGGSGGTLPTLLSETGAFADLASLTPAAGVIPYDIIAPLWSDGAEKFRWVAIPNDGTQNTPSEQILYQETEDWTYPTGTVFIKHFELALDESAPGDTRRLETRFLVHGENNVYYGFTYQWNEAGTDATLLEASVTEDFTITEAGGGTRQQTWYFPGQSDCFACHTSAAGYVLGPKTRQMNSDQLYPVTGRVGNQLESLNHIGVFSPAININGLSQVLTSKNLADESASLEERARSYLDSNCAGCHQPGGGTRSVMDLRLQISLEDAGVINGDVVDELGIAGAKIVVPGDPEASILYQRISQLQTGAAMPPLAKNKLDTTAVAMIHEWIVSLAGGTDIEDETPELPDGTVLHENYPNPFAQATTISYTLSATGPVRLAVYDVQGREVSVLVDATQPAGMQSVVFEAQDLPSGTYFYELRAGDFVESRKMLLVK
ncbi:MAG: PQQ-dependent sugar dehydrogenase [Bacteroidota bacterium]